MYVAYAGEKSTIIQFERQLVLSQSVSHLMAAPLPTPHDQEIPRSGELFLRMLKALILPLVVPSLITAVGSLDMSLSGKVATA